MTIRAGVGLNLEYLPMQLGCRGEDGVLGGI